jgi:striatin 1/3/4
MIMNLIGHTDAVTSLSLNQNNFCLASVGADGSMRTWDIRNYQCLNDIPVIF